MIPIYELRIYDWIDELMKLSVKGDVTKKETEFHYVSKDNWDIAYDMNKLFYIGEIPFRASCNWSNITITRFAKKFDSYWNASSDLRRGGVKSRQQYLKLNIRQMYRVRKFLVAKGYKKLENYKESDVNFAAEDSAKKILFESLDQENRYNYYDHEYLEISSTLFDDIYYHIPIALDRIRVYKRKPGDDAHWASWNVRDVISYLCLEINEDLPVHDIVLTKFLHLSYDEENMLRTGNFENVKENLLVRLEPINKSDKKFRKLFDRLTIEDFDYADIQSEDFSNVNSTRILKLLEEIQRTSYKQ
jgi:hypothetical protein